jgi:mono/diheme cytochrome c family protein
MTDKTKRLIAGVFCGAIAVFTAGCTAHKKPSKVETALANMAKDIVIPIEAEGIKNPLPDTDEVVKQGQQIYNQSCALCHGTDGHGGTDLGLAMYPPVMDLTSPHVQHWTDAEMFWIIQNGVRLTGMPSWQATLSTVDTWKVVRFIYALPRLDTTAATEAPVAHAKIEEDKIAYGKKLYRQEGCFMCHQLNGEGGTIGPNLTVEGTRGRSDDWLIGHFRDPGKYTKGSVMPPFQNATDEQLEALTTFLQSQKGPSGKAGK